MASTANQHDERRRTPRQSRAHTSRALNGNKRQWLPAKVGAAAASFAAVRRPERVAPSLHTTPKDLRRGYGEL